MICAAGTAVADEVTKGAMAVALFKVLGGSITPPSWGIEHVLQEGTNWVISEG